MSEFVHLHTHSDHSLRGGLQEPPVGGVVIDIQQLRTRAGLDVALATTEDQTGSCRLVSLPRRSPTRRQRFSLATWWWQRAVLRAGASERWTTREGRELSR